MTSFRPLRSSSFGYVLLQNSTYLPAASLTRNALPSSCDGTQAIGSPIPRSIACSTASGSLVPEAEKNLMPLSSNGLCDALITMPADQRSARVRYANAGVGRGPGRYTQT